MVSIEINAVTDMHKMWVHDFIRSKRAQEMGINFVDDYQSLNPNYRQVRVYRFEGESREQAIKFGRVARSNGLSVTILDDDTGALVDF